jgi:hypothetical protein
MHGPSRVAHCARWDEVEAVSDVERLGLKLPGWMTAMGHIADLCSANASDGSGSVASLHEQRLSSSPIHIQLGCRKAGTRRWLLTLHSSRPGPEPGSRQGTVFYVGFTASISAAPPTALGGCQPIATDERPLDLAKRSAIQVLERAACP